MKESIQVAIRSTSEIEIDQSIQFFREKLLLTIVDNTLLRERETKSIELEKAILRVKEGETTIKEECVILTLSELHNIAYVLLKVERLSSQQHTPCPTMDVARRHSARKSSGVEQEGD